MNKFTKHLKFIRLGLILLAIFLVVLILSKDLALGGSLTIKTDFKKFTPFVSILAPEARTQVLNQGININAEPVYFDLSLPRDFNQASLELTYQNDFNNLVEVGTRVGASGWELKPLENKVLDQLKWPNLQEGSLVLFQKEEKFKNIYDFLFNLPPVNEIATYNYDLDYKYKIADYQPTKNFTELKQRIYSSYQLLTYLKEEPLHFEFLFDANGNELNEDNTVLNVYDIKNNILNSFNAENNKIVADLSGLAEGVYKLELTVPGLTITKAIKTKQQYLSFVNQLDLLDSARLTTESKAISLLTFSNTGLQDIQAGAKTIKIENIGEKSDEVLPLGQKEIIIPKGEIEITGEGLFAFKPSQYFNPLIARVIAITDFGQESAKYVLADYQLTVASGQLKAKTVNFDLFNKGIKDGKLRFVISIPGLSDSQRGILIKSLKVKLTRSAIWQEGLMRNLIKYLKYVQAEIK